MAVRPTVAKLVPCPHRPNLNPRPTEVGEGILFAMAAAFGVAVIAIIGALFLPVAVGVGAVFPLLGVVLAAVGVFLARLLAAGQ
jgi:hypothetical protein